MQITTTAVEGTPVVTIIKVHGDIDGSNYAELSKVAEKSIESGGTHILLDLTDTAYMGSAGLVALQTILKAIRRHHSMEAGYSHAKGHFKLLNPGEQITMMLKRVDLESYFETFTDQDEAVASFGKD